VEATGGRVELRAANPVDDLRRGWDIFAFGLVVYQSAMKIIIACVRATAPPRERPSYVLDRPGIFLDHIQRILLTESFRGREGGRVPEGLGAHRAKWCRCPVVGKEALFGIMMTVTDVLRANGEEKATVERELGIFRGTVDGGCSGNCNGCASKKKFALGYV